MLIVADVAVEVFRTPEFPGAPQDLIRPIGGKRLHRMHYRRKRNVCERREQNMGVVRHQNPVKELVLFAVKA